MQISGPNCLKQNGFSRPWINAGTNCRSTALSILPIEPVGVAARCNKCGGDVVRVGDIAAKCHGWIRFPMVAFVWICGNGQVNRLAAVPRAKSIRLLLASAVPAGLVSRLPSEPEGGCHDRAMDRELPSAVPSWLLKPGAGKPEVGGREMEAPGRVTGCWDRAPTPTPPSGSR